jgi:hypothetical protein
MCVPLIVVSVTDPAAVAQAIDDHDVTAYSSTMSARSLAR